MNGGVQRGIEKRIGCFRGRCRCRNAESHFRGLLCVDPNRQLHNTRSSCGIGRTLVNQPSQQCRAQSDNNSTGLTAGKLCAL